MKVTFIRVRFAGRGRVIRLRIFIIVVPMLIKPASVSIKVEDMIGVFYRESTLVWKIVEYFKSLRLMSRVHFSNQMFKCYISSEFLKVFIMHIPDEIAVE